MYNLKLLFTLATIFFLSNSFSQTPITIGRYDTIFSQTFNENRVLRISVPTDIEKGKQEKYPVVFVLDGANHIYSLAGMIHRFSYDEGCEVTPEMIVVGIETSNRYEELTPNFEDDKFCRYLEEELIPFINENYPVMPYKILIGHSLGGLRTVHTALYQPNLFDAYIAVDPSLGNDRNKWYTPSKDAIENLSFRNKKMFVAMAQTMPTSMVQDIESIKKDTSGASNHMRKIIEFSEIMMGKNIPYNNSFNWKFYPDETHSSITQIGMYDGLKFIFDYYLNKTWPEVLDGDISSEEALSIMINHYDIVSRNLGTKTLPTENLLNMIIGAITRREQHEKAMIFAEYYKSIYPESEQAKQLVEQLSTN